MTDIIMVVATCDNPSTSLNFSGAGCKEQGGLSSECGVNLFARLYVDSFENQKSSSDFKNSETKMYFRTFRIPVGSGLQS